MTKPTISAVIPVYRSEKTLQELNDRLVPVLEVTSSKFEIIYIEDCGGDKSWEIISELVNRDDRVKGIQLSRNFGQQNAVLCGIRAAKNDITVTLDDDLQHPPEEIPKMLAELNKGFDVIYGARDKEQQNLFRNIASITSKFILKNTMGVKGAKDIGPFRAFYTRLRGAFSDFHSPYVSIDVLLGWGTTNISSVTVQHNPRQDNSSNYTFRKLVAHAINMFTGFSTIPLRIAILIGLGFTIFGILVFFYVIARFFIDGNVVPGFPFLASLIAIFSGAQLFALGITGEYIARIFYRSLGRPSSVIKNSIGFSHQNNHEKQLE